MAREDGGVVEMVSHVCVVHVVREGHCGFYLAKDVDGFVLTVMIFYSYFTYTVVTVVLVVFLVIYLQFEIQMMVVGLNYCDSSIRDGIKTGDG